MLWSRGGILSLHAAQRLVLCEGKRQLFIDTTVLMLFNETLFPKVQKENKNKKEYWAVNLACTLKPFLIFFFA